jgi:hypothetical protein
LLDSSDDAIRIGALDLLDELELDRSRIEAVASTIVREDTNPQVAERAAEIGSG